MKNKINYNEMTLEDLKSKVVEEKKKYLKMQFNHSVTPLTNPIELRDIRRNIARMLTALTIKNK